MSLRILHTADLHLGAKFAFLGEKASEYRKEVLDTFKKIVELAKGRHANIVLVAGDFFDSNKVPQYLIEFVKSQFAALQEAGIYVAILPGTHDALIPNEGVYLKEYFAEFTNVFVFHDPAAVKKEYPDLSLTVWGKVYQSNKSKDSALISFSKEEKSSTFNVLMAHGSLKIPGKYQKDDWPFGPEEIASSGADYIALGHWHGAQDISQKGAIAWYSGSPSLTDREEKGGLGFGHIILAELSQESGGKVQTSVEPIKVSAKVFIEEDIDITSVENLETIKKRIQEGAGAETIKIVNIKGLLHPGLILDAETMTEELKDQFFYLKINILAHLAVANISEEQYPKELVLGQYVEILKKKIANEENEEQRRLLEEALQIGLAELEGKNIL